MIKETGGPAFPLPAEWNGPELINYTQTGMSLRDYFAAKAMQAMMTASYGKGLFNTSRIETHLVFAQCAYEMADYLLKERDK